MKLLVLTQAADLDEPVLSFFHAWLAALSKRVEKVSVICLQEGRHALPGNVRVYSLGKPRKSPSDSRGGGPRKSPSDSRGAPRENLSDSRGRGRLVSRLKYIARLYRFVWSLRREYDCVFVHMNPEYVVLAGLLWWLWGKRVVLWRNHRRPDLFTRLAVPLSHAVCYTSPSAYVAGFKNAVRMPVGIDTDLFKPTPEAPERKSVLFLGRLDPVKKCDEFLRALAELARGGAKFRADVYGDPTIEASPYAAKFRADASPLAARGLLTLHRGVENSATPAIYASHALYVNLTPSGSFDKTIGEAMGSGCAVVAANDALRGVLPLQFIVDPDNAQSVASGIRAALELSEGERAMLGKKLREYVIREHSLSLLVERLMGILGG